MQVRNTAYCEVSYVIKIGLLHRTYVPPPVSNYRYAPAGFIGFIDFNLTSKHLWVVVGSVGDNEFIEIQ